MSTNGLVYKLVQEGVFMSMITNDWLEPLSSEFRKEYYSQLYNFVKDEYSKTVVYPPAEDIFNAFHFTPLDQVKVVILGQDPYHNDGQAHGLCFSVKPDVEIEFEQDPNDPEADNQLEKALEIVRQ